MKHVPLVYPSITHALVDLHVNQKNAVIFQHIGLDWNTVWRQIISYGKSMFDSAFDLLQNVAWETLFTLKQVPNYLTSLLRVIEQLLSQKSLSSTLYDAFYVGATKLWSVLVQLLPSSFQTDIGAQIQAFGQAFKTYGSVIWKAMQFLFSGIKKLVEALMVLYHRAVSALAEFSGLFVTSMSIFSPIKQRCTQTILFSFMLMQNVLELGNLKSNQAMQYLKLHAERLSSETQLLHSLVERLNPASKILQVLIQNQALQNVLQYINSSIPMVIFGKVFKFLNNIISNVITSVSSYITAFGLQAVHYMTNVLSKIMDLPEYDSVMNLTNAAQELSENKLVSQSNKAFLQEAVQIGTSFQTETLRANQNKYNDLAGLFENTWFAARVLSDYYHEVPVSQADQDRVCKDATGFKTADLLKTHGAVASLLQERISVVFSETFDKVKIESSLIGIRDDDNWLKEAFEKRQEISEIEQRIQQLERQIGFLKDTSQYVSEMEIYQRKRRDAMQELSRAGNEATRVYLSTLDALKANIEEANGITALKSEIALLKEQKIALQKSISQKSGRSKQVSGIVIVVVAAFVFGYIAIQIAEKQRRDVMVGSQYTFNSLLTASNNDPILQAQVQRFIEQEGINFADPTPNTLNRFQKYVASIAFDIENKKIDLETTEKDWALFIASSIRMHENKQKEEKSSAINVFWSYIKGETKSTDLALIEAEANAGSAIEKTFDSAAVGLLKNVDMRNFHIGWRAYNGNSIAEKQDAYMADVANILKAHFTAMSGIFGAEQKKYIQQANPGWMSQIATAISYGFKQTGAGGVDRKATTDDLLDSLAFGGVGFIVQQFVYYEASLVFFVTGIRIVLFTITALVGAVVNVVMGEQDIAYTLLVNLGNEALRGLGIVGAHWVRAATTIFYNRFSIVTLGLNLIMSAILIFIPAGMIWTIVGGVRKGIAWSWNRLTNCGRVQQVGRSEDARLTQEGRDAIRLAALANRNKEIYKIDAQICSTCNVKHSYAVCGHCDSAFYCSKGCADLHWPTHAGRK